MFSNPSEDVLREILLNARTIAVVGLSADPDRPSHAVSAQMQKRGYRIIPVNPKLSEVLGERSYPSLLDIPHPVDIVNVFRRSEALPDVVREAVQISAPVIWAQEGVYDEEAAAIAARHGKTMIMDRCIAVAHSILVGIRRT
ncbi:MAG: CoA-binding protein [Alicyclobacillaceae bacterium]|nr:CoA-binding protein [Alicyclobacillaceae bacterium]